MAGFMEKLRGPKTGKRPKGVPRSPERSEGSESEGEREEMKDVGKEEMTKVSQRVESLKASLEEKRKEIQDAEMALQAEAEKKKKEMEEVETTLKEAQWQEKLERADKELAHFYREERKKEDEINRAINKVFNEAAKDVEKINLTFKDLKELKKKISGIERNLIKEGNQDPQIRDAIEFKKAEIIREVGVTEQLKGGSPLVREVNIALGIQEESEEDLLGRGFSRLSIYAQNIYDEVKRASGKPVRARVDELIRVARIPEPRIIKARGELKKNLDLLAKKELITYEEEGDTFIITGNIKEEVRK